MGATIVPKIPTITEAGARKLRALEIFTQRRKLESSDIPLLFTLPATEELHTLDQFVTTCLFCGDRFELVLDDHAINRAMAGCLLSHARTHQPGQPGIRKLR